MSSYNEWMRALNLQDQVFGDLLVVSKSANKNGFTQWRCLCRRCGQETVVYTMHLRRGNPRACSRCMKKAMGLRYRTHGEAGKTVEYAAWAKILKRCLNPEQFAYKDYGKRGITVTRRWLKFENFLTDMGRRPSPQHSLDRKNNDKGYYKRNCCWATAKEQANNKRSNRYVYCFGAKRTLTQAAPLFGIRPESLRARLKKQGLWRTDGEVMFLS